MEVKTMKKLETIQKENLLNDVFAIDEIGPGGANHAYTVYKHGTAKIDEDGRIYVEGQEKLWDTDNENIIGDVIFQTGPRKESTSISGVLDSDLLEIVRDRLTSFQQGPFKCEENEEALKHVTEALEWMNKRVENRAKRGVLGTNKE